MSAWTEADDAESVVIVRALVSDYWEHRKTCPNCIPCPELESWRDHRKQCRPCQGDAPLTLGPPCGRRRQWLAHDKTRCSCMPCPHLQVAIREVVDWHESRCLLSTAEALRAVQDAA